MKLEDFFKEYPEVAIAFSGGVDSAYLLYVAVKYAKKVRAYYVKSDFQPQFELDDARRLARELNAEMKIIPLDVFSCDSIVKNPSNRCYFCKKMIFSSIYKAAALDGFEILLDGTNASDIEADRPGMKALRELQVRSPLRECGLTKTQIRELSRKAGLFTWDKPSYSCLATRITTNEEITKAKLEAIENGEIFLFKLGFSDFRLRMNESTAKLQLREEQIPLLIENREKILDELKKSFSNVFLDLEVRK